MGSASVAVVIIAHKPKPPPPQQVLVYAEIFSAEKNKQRAHKNSFYGDTRVHTPIDKQNELRAYDNKQ